MVHHTNLAYLRPTKRRKTEECYQQIEFRLHLNAYEYHHATILPIRKGPTSKLDCGGVIDNEGEYILSSVIPGWASGYYDDYTCEYECKTVVYCGRMIGQWGHFLLETITRLWFFLEHDDPSYEYILIVRENTNPPVQDNFLEFFRLLGISDRLRFLSVPTQFETVLIPERSFQYKRFLSPRYKSIIDRVVRNACRYSLEMGYPDKIFLSRSSFPKAQRTEIGLSYLDHYFQNNGYELLHPEKLRLMQLICMFSRASCLATESGTVAHNILFCNNHQDILIIERQCLINEAQLSIDCVQDLHATYVDGNLMVYPVTLGGGPFFLYDTPEMEQMTEDLSMLPPDSCYQGDEYTLACLQRYMAIYDETKDSRASINPEKNIELFDEARAETIGIIDHMGGKPKCFLDRLLHP